MILKPVYFGTAIIAIHDPFTSLVLIEKPDLSNEIAERLKNVNFRYTIPTVQFGIVNVPSVHIFDYREDVDRHIKTAFQEKDFSALIKSLKKPATIEVVKVNDQIYVFIIEAPDGTLKRNIKHTLEIEVALEGKVRTHKFLFFKGGSDSRETVSYATLYKSG